MITSAKRRIPISPKIQINPSTNLIFKKRRSIIRILIKTLTLKANGQNPKLKKQKEIKKRIMKDKPNLGMDDDDDEDEDEEDDEDEASLHVSTKFWFSLSSSSS